MGQENLSGDFIVDNAIIYTSYENDVLQDGIFEVEGWFESDSEVRDWFFIQMLLLIMVQSIMVGLFFTK